MHVHLVFAVYAHLVLEAYNIPYLYVWLFNTFWTLEKMLLCVLRLLFLALFNL